MRHRSRTNSRPGEDLALRNGYRDRNVLCEFPSGVCCKGRHGADDVHHVFHASYRVDVTSNLICLCREAHDWCHAHDVDGKLICLGVKNGKGELDRDEFQRCSVKRLEWWIDHAAAAHPAAVSAQRTMRGD